MGNKTCLVTKDMKCNSAFRLCYSLQLLPSYNEKHQLITIHPLRNSPMPARTRGDRGRLDYEASSRSILWVPVLFVVSTIGLYFLSLGFHDRSSESLQLKFPTSIEDISEMSQLLLHMKSRHFGYLLLLFCAGYIYKQTFAIPGSVFLNLLAGVLFGPYFGFFLACTLTATGATNCYMLSQTFGRSYVIKYFPDKVRMFQNKVESNGDSLFFFLLFLRLFPMSPNWMMNIVAPIVGVPVHLFFFSVFIGLMPYNFICVQTGSVLSQISSVSDIFTWWTMVKMLVVALVALLPGIIIKRLQVKSE